MKLYRPEEPLHEGEAQPSGFGVLAIAAIITAAAIGLLAVGYWGGHRGGYRDGQIDAISGHAIRYELTDHEDGSKSWEATP